MCKTLRTSRKILHVRSGVPCRFSFGFLAFSGSSKASNPLSSSSLSIDICRCIIVSLLFSGTLAKTYSEQWYLIYRVSQFAYKGFQMCCSPKRLHQCNNNNNLRMIVFKMKHPQETSVICMTYVLKFLRLKLKYKDTGCPENHGQ